MKAHVTYNKDKTVKEIKTASQIVRETPEQVTCKLHENGFPTYFNGKSGYQYTKTHYEDGWRNVVQPTFNNATHKRTNELEEIGEHPNKQVTYKVVALSQEEKDAYALAQAEAERKALRASLLEAGATIPLGDKTFHFTEAELQRFIVLKNEAEKGGLQAIEYPNTEGTWQLLTIAECTNLALIGMGIFQNIYKTTS